jgi:sec-independent protein translocase protein TatB
MFDLFSWSHILILLGVALVVVGPKELPRLMHMMGRWAGKARGMANEFKKSFDEMARQTELDELRKEVEALKNNNTLTGIQTSLNEAADVNAPATEAKPQPGTVAHEEMLDMVSPRSGELQVTETLAPTPAPAAPAHSPDGIPKP